VVTVLHILFHNQEDNIKLVCDLKEKYSFNALHLTNFYSVTLNLELNCMGRSYVGHDILNSGSVVCDILNHNSPTNVVIVLMECVFLILEVQILNSGAKTA
jgi:hypothetical protein